MNSATFCSDITTQNKILEKSLKLEAKNWLKIVIINNKEGVQETIIGKNTIHNTKIKLFQPLCNST